MKNVHFCHQKTHENNSIKIISVGCSHADLRGILGKGLSYIKWDFSLTSWKWKIFLSPELSPSNVLEFGYWGFSFEHRK